MTKYITLFLLSFVFTFISVTSFAQDGQMKSQEYTGTEIEKQFPSSNIIDISEIARLENELKEAIETGNQNRENLLRTRLNEFYKDQISKPNSDDRDYPLEESKGAFFQPEWLDNDVLVYNGDIGQTGSDHRRIDLKTGEDGRLYAAFFRRPATGLNGYIQIVKSTDGGQSWSTVSSISSSTRYFGQVSILVENRISNPDSSTILVFYSRSENSNFDNANIGFVSVRSDGANWTGGSAILSPAAGNKLLYPSAVSDGQYWTSATYFGVVCGEYSNSDSKSQSLVIGKTINWGSNFTSVNIIDNYPNWSDFFPVAAFKKGSPDSLYIAVERRFPSIKSQLRVVATPWTLSTGFNRYTLTTGTDNEYLKPSITIAQNSGSLPKTAVIAVIENNVARYIYSNNGGNSWSSYNALGTASENNIKFVAISSDSNSTSSDYVIGAYQMGGGDTIVVRRGRPGSLGTRNYQVNQFASSIFNAPVVAVYNPSGTKSSALLYTGLVSNYTSNVYFDGEHLVSSVSELPGVAADYSLEQNYPNPFNPSTAIRFSIPEQTNVSLKIFNSIGQEVAALINGEMTAGNHEVNFNASKLSSGIYFYRIETPAFTSTKKMILIK